MNHKTKRPCLDCKQLTTNTRCPTCTTKQQRARNKRRTHYQGTYPKRRAHLKATAPWTCWLCNKPITHPGDWTADHVTPADPHSELRPAHAHCNYSRGNNPGHTNNPPP